MAGRLIASGTARSIRFCGVCVVSVIIVRPLNAYLPGKSSESGCKKYCGFRKWEWDRRIEKGGVQRFMAQVRRQAAGRRVRVRVRVRIRTSILQVRMLVPSLPGSEPLHSRSRASGEPGASDPTRTPMRAGARSWFRPVRRGGRLCLGGPGALLDDSVQKRGGLQGLAIVRTENAPLCLETRPEELLGLVEPTQVAQERSQRHSIVQECARDARGPGLVGNDSRPSRISFSASSTRPSSAST